MKAVIVAAGMGSRILDYPTTESDKLSSDLYLQIKNHSDNQIPKSLLPFAEGTILSTILNNIAKAGIKQFVIVVGFKSQYVINYLKKNDHFGFKISFVENPEWKKGNGISVLSAEKEVGKDSFLLSMSDHIVSVAAIEKVVRYRTSKNLLLVDPKLENIFDIDDATKVQTTGNMITNIGKQIQEYNGIDCGIFKLSSRFFISMREKLKNKQESITASVQGLIQNNDMEAVFMNENDFWIDIDTLDSYQYALQNLLPKVQ